MCVNNDVGSVFYKGDSIVIKKSGVEEWRRVVGVAVHLHVGKKQTSCDLLFMVKIS